MRVSEHFSLGRTQPALEFVDVDTKGDTPLFIDPRALLAIGSEWSDQCVALLQSFFDSVIRALSGEEEGRARRLLASLTEPNETRLGLSKGRARGRGMGPGLADRVWDALSQSEAVTTGLIEDLEDTILFVPGIGFDIISDIATNIIRAQLIEFTQDVCGYYDIPLTGDVESRRVWDPQTNSWKHFYVPLPVTNHGPLLLVPKSIVRRVPMFDPGEYFNHYVLTRMQDDELGDPASSLVEVLKDGRRRVTKKSLKDRYGQGKRVNLETTLRHPDLLAKYRSAKNGRRQPPGHHELATQTDTEPPDWDKLLNDVIVVPTGRHKAATYHRAVHALLNAVLYPALGFGTREFKIHEGRKRIDINFINLAESGFFFWLHAVHGTPSAFIAVECKNYGNEIANPEIDQLLGRFADRRTRVGFLIHRGYGDKKRIAERCRDAASDGNGFILALDDDDLCQIVAERRQPGSLEFKFLWKRFNDLL